MNKKEEVEIKSKKRQKRKEDEKADTRQREGREKERLVTIEAKKGKSKSVKCLRNAERKGPPVEKINLADISHSLCQFKIASVFYGVLERRRITIPAVSI